MTLPFEPGWGYLAFTQHLIVSEQDGVLGITSEIEPSNKDDPYVDTYSPASCKVTEALSASDLIYAAVTAMPKPQEDDTGIYLGKVQYYIATDEDTGLVINTKGYLAEELAGTETTAVLKDGMSLAAEEMISLLKTIQIKGAQG